MLDLNFCQYLEYQISKALANSSDPIKQYCWCDGILLPLLAEDYSPTKINNTKQVVTRAYLGRNGQDIYELTIYFGKKAVRYYMRGNDLMPCVPSIETDDWIVLDIVRQTAKVQLH